MSDDLTDDMPAADPADETGAKGVATPPPVISSQDLLAGGREVVIRHGAERYRLLLTGRNRLILVK
jgi:hemin uptake protein HemP